MKKLNKNKQQQKNTQVLLKAMVLKVASMKHLATSLS